MSRPGLNISASGWIDGTSGKRHSPACITIRRPTCDLPGYPSTDFAPWHPSRVPWILSARRAHRSALAGPLIPGSTLQVLAGLASGGLHARINICGIRIHGSVQYHLRVHLTTEPRTTTAIGWPPRDHCIHHRSYSALFPPQHSGDLAVSAQCGLCCGPQSLPGLDFRRLDRVACHVVRIYSSNSSSKRQRQPSNL
jgi:hypothetical protein